MIGFFTRKVAPLVQRTLQGWQQDECGEMAAALAYYGLFSLFPLLLVILSMVGSLVGPNTDANATILRLAAVWLPGTAYELVEQTLRSLNQARGSVGLVGFATLLLGASGFFGALDRSFDKIWRVSAPAARVGMVGRALAVLKDKAIAFALVFACVLLVLFSLIGNLATEVLYVLARDLGSALGLLELDDVLVLQGIQLAVTLVALTIVLALVYSVLPSARVRLGDVWLGALITTALLLILQRLVIGGIVNLGASYESYGVIGGVMLLLFWIYLSTQLLLLGAEFTHAYATLFGSRRSEEA